MRCFAGLFQFFSSADCISILNMSFRMGDAQIKSQRKAMGTGGASEEPQGCLPLTYKINSFARFMNSLTIHLELNSNK